MIVCKTFYVLYIKRKAERDSIYLEFPSCAVDPFASGGFPPGCQTSKETAKELITKNEIKHAQ